MIQIINCSKHYKKTKKTAIDDINCILPDKGMIGIYGDSGSGKTTFLNCLGGLDRFSSGHIKYNDLEVKSLEQLSAYVFQEAKFFDDFTAKDNLKLINSNISDEIIASIMDKVGLTGELSQSVSTLSGGQKQRLSIARALLLKRPILLCDEPTSNLDEDNSKAVMDLLLEVSKNKLVIVVCHAKSLIKEYTNNLIQVINGKMEIEFTSQPSQKATDNNFSPIKNKLSLQFTNQICLRNIRYNVVKTVMTVLFIAIAMTFLTLIFSIFLLNQDKVIYENHARIKLPLLINEYEIDSVSQVNKYSLDNDSIEMLNPDAFIVGGIIKLFYFETEYKFTEYNFMNLLVLRKSNENFRINDNEILITHKYAVQLSEYNPEAVVGKTLKNKYGELLIVGILEDNDIYGVVIKEKTMRLFEENYDENESTPNIAIVNMDSAKLFFPTVYTDGLINGRYPLNDSEVALNREIIEWLFPEETPESFLDKPISLNILTKNFVPFAEHYDNLIKKEFTLVGITNGYDIFTPATKQFLILNYGQNRLYNSFLTAVFFEYNLNTIAFAKTLGMYPLNDIGITTINSFNYLKSFYGLFEIALIIAFVIGGLSMINCIVSSVKKTKKELGILFGFGISKKEMTKIFFLEMTYSLIVSLILSIIGYVVLMSVFNNQIIESYSISIIVLSFDFISMLISAGSILIISTITIIATILLTFRKPLIDIILER